MQPGRRFHQFLLLLLVLTSLYQGIYSLYTAFKTGEAGVDSIARWGLRFKPVLEALPIQRGTLGYLVEWDVPGADYVYHDLDTEYILAQYTFAPFILERGVDHEWIVAILNPKAYSLWKRTRIGEYEEMKFKGNIYLLHRLDLAQ